MVDESNEQKPPLEDDEPRQEEEPVDEELIELATEKRRGSILRPILFITVIWFGASIIGDWQTELEYFFSSSDPVEVGSVTDFAAERAKDEENWEPPIPHNRYVSLEGVPSRRAQSESYKFFKLVGDHVYVEVSREDDGKSELEREFDNEKGDTDRTYFEGAGRAVDLSKTQERYRGLREYYFERYRTVFCDTEIAEQQAEEARKAATQGDEDEVAEPACVNGYLIEADVSPSSHWWYLALSVLIGVFILLNVWWLVRWIRDFFRA